MGKKYPATQLIRSAFIWGIEGMDQMIDGLHDGDPHRDELMAERAAMADYYIRRFGVPHDPTKDAQLLDARTMQPVKAKDTPK